MPKLQRLRPDHAPALLSFERGNRAFFAASVPDRGDAYFTDFAARHEALLAEQTTGACHFHVLVAEDGKEILGRFNLVDVTPDEATLGFRLAQKATGQGLATTTVRHLFTLCTESYTLTTLHAAATLTNTSSRSVLTRTGFVATGEEVVLGGKRGLAYVRQLGSAGSTGAGPPPASASRSHAI